MTYMGWMIMNMKAPVADNIRQALDYHYKKYGTPPNLLEHSNLLSDVPNIDGVELVPINIPKNILYIGVKPHDTLSTT